MPMMQKMSSHGLSLPWDIASSSSTKSHFKTSTRQINNLRAIRLNKPSLRRFRPFSFFGCPWCKKWVRTVFRHFQTTLQTISPKSNFKTYRKHIMVYKVHSPTWIITFATWINSLFLVPMKYKMSSHGLSTLWNIVSLNSTKSHF
jgi:hypothetical protein